MSAQNSADIIVTMTFFNVQIILREDKPGTCIIIAF